MTNGIRDPLEENYYALLLAIIYPYTLTADEAFSAIRYGIDPLKVDIATLTDSFRLAYMKKEPNSYRDRIGRKYEMVLFFSDMIREVNESLEYLNDYEFPEYFNKVRDYTAKLKRRVCEKKHG